MRLYELVLTICSLSSTNCYDKTITIGDSISDNLCLQLAPEMIEQTKNVIDPSYVIKDWKCKGNRN